MYKREVSEVSPRENTSPIRSVHSSLTDWLRPDSSPELYFLKKGAGRLRRRIMIADSTQIPVLVSTLVEARLSAALISRTEKAAAIIKTAVPHNRVTLPDS